MTASRCGNHHTYISREQLTDLWRADCPGCGPVAVGQGYRVDVLAMAARHRDAHSFGPSAHSPHLTDTAAELPGRVHTEHPRSHRRPLERRDLAPLSTRVTATMPRQRFRDQSLPSARSNGR